MEADLSFYEFATLLASAIAAFISIIAIIASSYAMLGQNRLQQENLKLQKSVSDLAAKQLEMLLADEQNKLLVKFRLEIYQQGRGYKFYLTNKGSKEAANVRLAFEDMSQIIQDEYNEKFPMAKMEPSQIVSLIASLDSQSPIIHKAKVEWINPDGSSGTQDLFCSIV